MKIVLSFNQLLYFETVIFFNKFNKKYVNAEALSIGQMIPSGTNSPPAPCDSNTNVSDSDRHRSQDVCPPISQIVLKNFIKNYFNY